MPNLSKRENKEIEREFTSPIEEILFKYRFQFVFVLIGVILIGLGVSISNKSDTSKIEIIETSLEDDNAEGLVVEVSGAVENSGVYQLNDNARIEDAIILAGGISSDADRNWMEKTLNRAAKLVDGQKIYIPRKDEQSAALSANNSVGVQSGSLTQGSSLSQLININNASQNELESMWGIGPVTAQNIIEQRPYSTVEELLQKKIIKSNVYERNKDLISVY